MTLELNFCLESVATLSMKLMHNGSEKAGSPRSTIAWVNKDTPRMILTKLTDVLNDVIAEGILNEVESVVGDVANEPTLLVTRGMINAALENAATMAVSADGNAVGADGIEDELCILGREMVKALLDDVVTVQVLNEMDDLELQRLDDDLDLRIVSISISR